MQNNNEKNSSGSFEWMYEALCRKKNVKPLLAVQTYLQKNYVRFCADHVNLKDWSPIINSIIQDRSLSKICVYSRCRYKRIREKLNTEEKLAQSRRCARNGRQQPALYTNFLLRCFVHSVAACLRDSLMITSLVLDGIPLAPKYLKILADGLANNRNLRSLSLARCRIGDAGCDTLLESLQCNPNLHILNLSSCCLTNRCAASLSLFFKKRKADLLQNMWKEPTLPQSDACATMEEGLRVLILDKNHKFSDVGLRQLIRILKHDFWLRTLCLRGCGITQHGGELALELLQTNSVLTHIDLRDNEVSTDVLHTIRIILKRRKSKGERIPMKRRLLSRKHVLEQEMISKKAFSDNISKDCVKREFPVSKLPSKSKMQYVSQSACAWKTRRKDDEKCKSRNEVRKSHIKWTNANELKKCLLLMIENNQSLITALENSTDFLMKERDRRLSAEEAYHKLQPHLRSLKNKIAMQNSIHSNMRYENQVYTNLQNVFNELRTAVKEKRFGTTEKNLKETGENKNNAIVRYHKNEPYQSEIAHLSHTELS